ncbi:hypothetical protein PIB30_054097 [Stylosanthes scabra]|uniref:Uncharacterized protein n=1 Tax=Stylosanthes scabra TaxID=79078 RepID=A0ABU6RIK8_9FABA|nr:hypothetical protein [Stylosanthes scabra]
MEVLSMFQRPRPVALEYEKPGTYRTVLIYPLDRLGDRSSNGAVAGELNMCADLDLEIERTLRHARQVRRQIEFENSLHSQTENLAAEETSVDSSLSDSESEKFFSPTHVGTLQMVESPRVTLRQMGGASVALENQPMRYPKRNENFELKTGLINLLPRFHGMPREDLTRPLGGGDALVVVVESTASLTGCVGTF